MVWIRGQARAWGVEDEQWLQPKPYVNVRPIRPFASVLKHVLNARAPFRGDRVLTLQSIGGEPAKNHRIKSMLHLLTSPRVAFPVVNTHLGVSDDLEHPMMFVVDDVRSDPTALLLAMTLRSGPR